MREHVRNSVPKLAIAPALRTASVIGTVIDRLGFEAVSLIVTSGAWTDGVHTVTAEESVDGTTWTVVPTTSLTDALPVIDGAGKAGVASAIGYTGDARYLRLKSTVTGSPATGAIVGAVAMLGRARNRPFGSGLA